MHVVLLLIDAITVDPEIQPRVNLDDACAQEYANQIMVGDNFPPVTVFSDGAKYWLADGFHRHQAHVLAGHRSIRAEVRTGTKRDAILYSVSCNANHGLRRTNGDKRRAVTMLLIDEDWWNWSNNQIAKACGVSHTLVGEIRREVASISGFKFSPIRQAANGTTMDTSRIGKASHLKKETKGKIKPVSEQIEELSLILNKIVDRSRFNPDEVDELDDKIAKAREELKAMSQAMRFKRSELSTLEVKRQRLTSVALQ